ncbi:hypothetical protein F5B22DRAFT_631081 [Xylaria bambusicola]|uniref:uncharacterized protein n=1 Tax=Xylaria bambusicola TaxID=326684 RepID=UPI0020082B67|nr:uncharacterized protein F5B22DRAFT_631081 [Xylaria bambusicola]KAI0502968.1 hypothetical protein F5B22DRAFT_631081 [Xylaria bambusicola]
MQLRVSKNTLLVFWAPELAAHITTACVSVINDETKRNEGWQLLHRRPPFAAGGGNGPKTYLNRWRPGERLGMGAGISGADPTVGLTWRASHDNITDLLTP